MATWDESKHKRGQPGNAGQFGSGGGGGATTDGGGKPATKKSRHTPLERAMFHIAGIKEEDLPETSDEKAEEKRAVYDEQHAHDDAGPGDDDLRPVTAHPDPSWKDTPATDTSHDFGPTLPHGHKVVERLKPREVSPERWASMPTKFEPHDWSPEIAINAAAKASKAANGATVNVWHGPKGWVASAQPAPKDVAMGRYYQIATKGNTIHGQIVDMADAAHHKFFGGPGGD